MDMRERIAPYEIVSLIDEIFPGVARLSIHEAVRLRLTSEWMPQLSAILHLVDGISEKLSPRHAYLDVVMTAAAIRAIVVSWLLGDHDRRLEYLPGLGAHHPIVVLRQALLSCSEGYLSATNAKRLETGWPAENGAINACHETPNVGGRVGVSSSSPRSRRIPASGIRARRRGHL